MGALLKGGVDTYQAPDGYEIVSNVLGSRRIKFVREAVWIAGIQFGLPFTQKRLALAEKRAECAAKFRADSILGYEFIDRDLQP